MIEAIGGLELLAFKRVDCGYLFEDRPWIIGPRRCYRVTDDEAVEIATRLRLASRRLAPFTITSTVLIVLCFFTAAPMLVRFLGLDQDSSEFIARSLGIVAFVAEMVGIHLCRRRMIRPVIADLTPTSERISFHEKLRSIALKTPLTILIVSGVIAIPVGLFVPILLGMLLWYGIRFPWLLIVIAIGGALLCGCFVYIFVIRLGAIRGGTPIALR